MATRKVFSFIFFAILLTHTFASESSKTTSPDDTSAASSSSEGKNPDFFGFWGFPHFWFHPHPHPWPFVHPPLPSGGIPKFHWPLVHPPMPSGGFKFPHWPFVHPPMPSGGGFKFPHWPFVHPPMPSGGFKFPHWPFVHPPMPSGGFHHFPHFPWFPIHPHGGSSSGNSQQNVGEDGGDVKPTSDDARCSSTNAIVESCMRKNSFSWSYGYSFDPDCCKAITAVNDDCADQESISMIKHQCKNVAAPPPIAN